MAAWASTITTSCVPCTVSVRLMAVSLPAISVNFSILDFRPVASPDTKYSPACSSANRYWPLGLVTAEWLSLVSVNLMVTLALGTTAPLESVTTPTISPVVAVWLCAAGTPSSRNITARPANASQERLKCVDPFMLKTLPGLDPNLVLNLTTKRNRKPSAPEKMTDSKRFCVTPLVLPLPPSTRRAACNWPRFNPAGPPHLGKCPGGLYGSHYFNPIATGKFGKLAKLAGVSGPEGPRRH